MALLRWSLLISLAAFVGVPTSHAGEDPAVCPTNSWGTGPYGESSTDPVHSFPFGDGYNLITGSMTAASSGGSEGGASMFMLVRDVYWIVGPASTDPISFRVKLHTIGVAGGGIVTPPYPGPFCSSSRATIRLSSGAVFQETTAGSESDPVCTGPVAIYMTQEIELAHLPNESFEVAYRSNLSNGTLLSVWANSTFWFEGLPDGYSIQSCQGYAGPVVPVSGRSWGSLKHAYR